MRNAKEIAYDIVHTANGDYELLKELCRAAGMEEEYVKATPKESVAIVFEAAKKLNVDIIGDFE